MDEYADLLRLSVSSAANDHRLGANEAPPAIVSVFLGDQLTAVLEGIENGSSPAETAAQILEIGVETLPKLPKDATDRNRTSPFAFTGNKFEFRMLGSSISIADPNVVLNTIVAEALCEFADQLECASDFTAALGTLFKDTIKEHKRIIFNGNNYSDEWVVEAEKRGLPNLHSSVDAIPVFIEEKNVKLFTKHSVFSGAEIHSRYEIMLETYSKAINIEALTMLDMAKKDILPAAIEYTKVVCDALIAKKSCGITIDTKAEETEATKLSRLSASLVRMIETLDKALLAAKECGESLELAKHFRSVVLPAMQNLRAIADELETIVGEKYWPFPTYGQMLFIV